MTKQCNSATPHSLNMDIAEYYLVVLNYYVVAPRTSTDHGTHGYFGFWGEKF